MRIEQLEYFVSVATHASFTKAAEECHVAQPAISTQIKALEQELGFKLFTRGPQGATLTEPGAMYFDVAKSLLKTMANAAQRGRSIAQGFSGDLSFGVFGHTQANDMAPVSLFHAHYPDVSLHFSRASLAEQYRQLKAGKFDVLFTETNEMKAHGDVVVAEARNNELCLIVGANHPLAHRRHVSLSEIKDSPYLFAHESIEDGGDFGSELRSRLTEPLSAAFVEDHDIALLLIQLGLGVQIAPRSIAPTLPPSVVALRIDNLAMTIETGWAYLAENNNPALARFVSLVEENGHP